MPLAPIAERVSNLLDAMTLDEMIAQLWLRYPCSSGPCFGAAMDPALPLNLSATGVGYFSIRVATNRTGASLADNLAARNAIALSVASTSRLRIPVAWEEEGLHSGAWGGTLFPGLQGLGASFDADLAQRIGAAIALEARAAGVDTVYAPEVNMFDPRNGRYSEGFSEDPMVSGALGAAMVRGLQCGPRAPGTRIDNAATYLPDFSRCVLALGKHFVAYGADAGGLNSGITQLDNRTLAETYFKPWRALCAAGLRGVMVAHATTQHIPNHAHPWLLTRVLRQGMGLGSGLVFTDDNNILPLVNFGVAKNASHAAARALAAGVDVDLQGNQNVSALGYTRLPQALQEGLVTPAQVRAAASRVLTAKFASGLFDTPVASPQAALGELQSPAHRALAAEAAAASLVLLVNRAWNGSSALPLAELSGSGARVAVLGDLAACASGGERGAGGRRRRRVGDPHPSGCPARQALLGPYSLWNASALYVPTVFEALTAAYPGTEFVYSRGGGPDEAPGTAESAAAISAAATAAAASSATLLLVGDSTLTAYEGNDRDSLDPPGTQLALLYAVGAACAAAGKPLILLVLPCRPFTFGPGGSALENVSALLVAWHPGQEGGAAIAGALGGRLSPGGRLPSAWPRSVGHIGSGASPWSLARRNGEWLGLVDDNPAKTLEMCDGGGICYSAYTSGAAVPAFALGAGGGYANLTFDYASLAAAVAPLGSLSQCGPSTPLVTANITISNVGAAWEGRETVLAFLADPLGESLVVRHWKRLVGFARSPTLRPMASAPVTVAASCDDVAVYDDGMRLVVLPGVYTLSVAPSADARGGSVQVEIGEDVAAAATGCLQTVFDL